MIAQELSQNYRSEEKRHSRQVNGGYASFVFGGNGTSTVIGTLESINTLLYENIS